MEEVAATQEKVVEKLKTLEPEQLVKATGLMGEALMTLGDSVVKMWILLLLLTRQMTLLLHITLLLRILLILLLVRKSILLMYKTLLLGLVTKLLLRLWFC